MSRRETKLIRASNLLSKYFGLTTIKDLAARVALEEVVSPNLLNISQRPSDNINNLASNNTRTVSNSPRISDISIAKKKLISLLIDTTEGARTTYDIVKTINNEIISDADENTKIELGRLTQIHYTTGHNFAVSSEESNGVITHISAEQAQAPITEIMNNVQHPFINQSSANPNKEQPGLSVILSNSTRVSLQQRYINPMVIFFNSIPNVELQRAIPYTSVEFIVDRAPLSKDKRIQSIGLTKFLLGAEKIDPNNKSLYGLTIAQALGSNEENTKTMGGMELFTSPQTMVNADQFNVSNSVRANPVLDKFRPFLTLNEININIVPSTGMMSFKTARLSFTLHDRSRLNEIAEFIRPDFYSTNEILIEYGWSHPDGTKEDIDNPYADLLNGLRVKEKYMIRNSNFSMDDAGQIIINLDLAMRGGTEFDTEIISSNEDTFGDVLKEIEELEKVVVKLKETIFPQDANVKQKEIRGAQILNAAQDARNYLTFSKEFKEELKQLRKFLRSSQGSNPNVKSLLNAITKLYGEQIDLRRTKESGNFESFQAAQGSKVSELRRSVVEQITRKVAQLREGPDPFITILTNEERKIGLNSRERFTQPSRDEEQKKRLNEFRQRYGQIQVPSGQPVSLAKLLLHFIGEPLAATKRYDDIQMIFYPFNNYAGAARRLNIGNFIIDLSYFADEFVRYKLNNLGKDGNMSLRQFINFIDDIVISDMAAPSYGLDNLFETVVSSDGTYLDTRSRFEAPDYQTRLESKLSDYGIPGGEFRMPQIDFYVEALPERLSNDSINDNNVSEKTILRIHVFDKLATTYESVGTILKAARNNAITTIGNAIGSEKTTEGNSSVAHFHSEEYSKIIQFARELGLIEIENNNSNNDDLGPDSTIKFIGRNSESIKQFVLATTPYVLYGAGNTTIKNASLASQQDARLSTVNMVRSFKHRDEIRPSGEQVGRLPVKILPCQLTMQTFGCPFISFAQQIFIDFSTNTTADNIYGVVGVDHRISQGEFSSEVKLIGLDSFGTYESLLGRLNSIQGEISNVEKDSQTNILE